MIYIVIAVAIVAIAAIWKVTDLQKSLATSRTELSSSRIEAERARSESAVELATARQLARNLQEHIERAEQEHRLNTDSLNSTLANTREALSHTRGERPPGHIAGPHRGGTRVTRQATRRALQKSRQRYTQTEFRRIQGSERATPRRDIITPAEQS